MMSVLFGTEFALMHAVVGEIIVGYKRNDIATYFNICMYSVSRLMIVSCEAKYCIMGLFPKLNLDLGKIMLSSFYYG